MLVTYMYEHYTFSVILICMLVTLVRNTGECMSVILIYVGLSVLVCNTDMYVGYIHV